MDTKFNKMIRLNDIDDEHVQFVISCQHDYISEQIKYEPQTNIQTYRKVDVPKPLLNELLSYHGVDTLDNYTAYEFVDGSVKHYLIANNENEMDRSQWVVTGFEKYTQIEYPSIYLGANLFQHNYKLFAVNSSGVLRLDYLMNERLSIGGDEEMIKNYIHYLTGKHPSYITSFHKTEDDNVYLTLNIQMSLPTEDNQWGELTNHMGTHIVICRVGSWRYVVTTMNLPSFRHGFYVDNE